MHECKASRLNVGPAEINRPSIINRTQGQQELVLYTPVWFLRIAIPQPMFMDDNKEALRAFKRTYKTLADRR